MRYLRFLFGSPRRLLFTVIGIGFFVCLVNPELFEQAMAAAIHGTLKGISVLLAYTAPFIVIWFALKAMVKGKRGNR